MRDDKLMEGMYFSDRCAFCSEFGEKKRPHVCERCFIAAMELAASEHPAPPPQGARGEGDDFRSDAVALARLVLETFTDTGFCVSYPTFSDMRRFARKLTGEQECKQ